jgi:hypothetical protein
LALVVARPSALAFRHAPALCGERKTSLVLLDALRAMRDDFLIQDAASFEGKEVSLNPDSNRRWNP